MTYKLKYKINMPSLNTSYQSIKSCPALHLILKDLKSSTNKDKAIFRYVSSVYMTALLEYT